MTVKRLAISTSVLLVFFTIGSYMFSKAEREAELDNYRKNRFFYYQMKEL
jgi:hypothetical protein